MKRLNSFILYRFQQIFVLQGAFEIEDRLLHAKDGLAIWNTGTIDFEALPNDTIIILLEMSL